jgi:hypothetical protein
MADISGFGLVINCVASVTFPSGFKISQFADDGDPLDLPSLQIGDKAMGVNGDMISWRKANPIAITINVIPNSEDDKNLAILFEANRAGKGKKLANDVITMTAIYPDGKTTTLTAGAITDGMPSNSVASAGRLKSKAYIFAFENIQGS